MWDDIDHGWGCHALDYKHQIMTFHYADMQMSCVYPNAVVTCSQFNGSAVAENISIELFNSCTLSILQPAVTMAETADSKPSNKRFRKDKRKHRVDRSMHIDRFDS